ncbi:MAG: glycosyltransferase [Gemmatimonadales bacterium]
MAAHNPITRICILSTHGYMDPVPRLGSTDTGGQVVYVLELAKAFTRLGIAVDIYTRWFDRDRRQIDPLPKHPGARIIRIPAGPWEFIPKEEIYDILPELAENMVRFVLDQGLDYDLLHAHYVDAGIVMLAVAERLNRPTFFTAHSLGAWKREQLGGDPGEMDWKFKFERRISEERRIFRTVSAQTVTSALQRDKIRELYGWQSQNIEVIPPGVDIGTFKPPKAGRPPPPPRPDLPAPYVFCLSRIDSGKGHDFLIDAFDLVRRAVPDVHLVIGGGSPKPQLRESAVLATMHAIIDKRRLHDHVTIAGYVPDDLLVPYYQGAALFVLPSVFEPFGMTVLEAMACGTAVVASRLGGIRTVIASGQNGLLVDPTDRDEFAAAIVRLIEDRTLAKRLGRAGRSTVIDEFSWEAIARRHLALFDEHLDR